MAAFAVGMDAVNGEAVLAARQSASQARCSAHPPSRPWRVGRALQEQGQPYSTLQREYLPSLTGEPPLPHNAHYRQPHRCVHGSRQLALRFTARLCGGCAAAPCRAANGRRQWPVECSHGRANPSTQRHSAAAVSASVRDVVSQVCHGITERRIRSERRAEPAAVSHANRALPPAGHAARPSEGNAADSACEGPSPGMHRTSHRAAPQSRRGVARPDARAAPSVRRPAQ
jgi:hypothetical protein